jgi:MoxR-like ATPase
VTSKDLFDVLYKEFSQPERSMSFILTGKPGCGKTAIATQAATKARKQLMVFALPTCEAVDLRGLPSIVDGRTVWHNPLPREGEGVVILDELSSAAPDVQVAAHHLMWSETGSDMSLPAGWHIVATGNSATDKTLYRAPSAPLRNRCQLISVETDAEQWVNWAMAANINSAILGFIRWRPELIVAKEVPGEGAFPSPRAWERASHVISFAVSAAVERELLVGTIGEGATTEFIAYLRTVRELPSITSILANPTTIEVPQSPSLLYALASNLAQYTRQSKKSAMQYIARMPAEFALLWIRDVRDHYDITTDKDIRAWIGKHKSLFEREL